jgi:glycosyltransferase involved in cell wall biosynthesis
VVPVKIAILGTRGVPPTYGGFETFAAELGVRLVARGHEVSVYCREGLAVGGDSFSVVEPRLCHPERSRGIWGSGRGEVGQASRPTRPGPSTSLGMTEGLTVDGVRLAGDRDSLSVVIPEFRQDEKPQTTANRQPPTANWNGIHRIVLPAARGKYFETVSHAFLCALDALRRDFDVVLVCNAANAFVLPLLRAARVGTAINVDGIERKRRKWNVLGRAVYAIGEAFSVSFAKVVADADVIADYYRAHYALEPEVIPYGAEFPREDDSDVLARLGLRPGSYILYVSRFEPENNPLEVVRAYEKLGDGPPLVMLGKGLYASELVAELHRHRSERVLFPGGLYGPDYRTLQRNAQLYVQATEVGGTHPALIEAMGSGGCVVALDTPENREVGGDAVGYFRFGPAETLSGTLRECLADDSLCEERRGRARERVARLYSWDRVTDAYEELFRSL